MPKGRRRYTYAEEKLSQARRSLMAPHGVRGEDGAFLAAFEMVLRLHPEDVDGLPDRAGEYWRAIEDLMDTSGLEDPQKIGLHSVLLASMDYGKRADFSNNVDELAHWLSDYESSHG